MFVPGNEAKNFVEILEELQVQPAGIDLSVAEVHEFVEAGTIDFTNEKRKLPATKKLEFGEKILLKPGVYKIVYNEVVKVPEDCVGLIFPRSSLLRMGATIFGAVWDPGYVGKGSGLLAVFNPFGIVLYRNARVAQIVFIKGKASGTYRGAYQFEGL